MRSSKFLICKIALLYLPEYLPYHTPGSSHISVSEWVIEQAKKPLYTCDPNELSTDICTCTGTGLVSQLGR